MNLMINTYCNLHCPYCFAQTEMKNNIVKNISKENFKIYLDFLKNNEEPDVRIIGGEPTLHPDFFELLDIVIDYNCFERVVIFSNFTFDTAFAEKIIKYNDKIEIEFLPNVNNNDKIDIVESNLDLLSAAIPLAVERISINIYDPKQDMSFWERIICKYNIRKIRWSITVPNMKLKQDFNFKEYFHSFQDCLYTMLDWVVKYHVDLQCDCNNPPVCAFDDDFVVYAMKVCPYIFGDLFCDTAAMDVTPDLDIIGCFGCNKYRKPLKNFSSIEEIYQDIQIEEMPLRKTPPQEECLRCPRHETTGMFCSCLGYRKEN